MRAISGLFVTLLATAVTGQASAQTSAGPAGVRSHAVGPDDQRVRRPTSWIEGQGRPITIKGEGVCLKHRNPKGPQTLECAMGFRGDDEKFYGLYGINLRDWIEARTPIIGSRVQITGTLWPSTSDKYVDTETIEVQDSKPINDPKALAGEYVCLPEQAETSKPTDCTPGIKTRGGFYWMFYPVTTELRAQLSNLAAGDRLAVEGTIQAQASLRLVSPHPDIEAVLRVASVNSVSVESPAPKAGL